MTPTRLKSANHQNSGRVAHRWNPAYLLKQVRTDSAKSILSPSKRRPFHLPASQSSDARFFIAATQALSSSGAKPGRELSSCNAFAERSQASDSLIVDRTPMENFGEPCHWTDTRLPTRSSCRSTNLAKVLPVSMDAGPYPPTNWLVGGRCLAMWRAVMLGTTRTEEPSRAIASAASHIQVAEGAEMLFRTYLKRWLIVASTISALGFTSYAIGHSGGLDQYGCHHDTRDGSYHCHR